MSFFKKWPTRKVEHKDDKVSMKVSGKKPTEPTYTEGLWGQPQDPDAYISVKKKKKNS